MYARVNTIFGRPERVEDGIVELEESDRGAVEATDGNQGLTTVVNRGAGVIVAVSYWDEPMDSSAATLTRARADAVAATGGDLVVEHFEVASQEMLSSPEADAVVRMVRVRMARTAQRTPSGSSTTRCCGGYGSRPGSAVPNS